MTSPQVPESLAEIQEEFLGLDEQSHRLELLLEFANELPDLPARYLEHPDLLEQVVECQSPVYIFVEVDASSTVTIFATAPKESPTTRGFASILVQGLSGSSAQQVLSVPDDYPQELGLTKAVSLLRIRGMVAMLHRIKRQVRERMPAVEPSTANS